MTELSQTERMALRRIINLLPAIEKQFGVGEYLDDDKIIKYVQPQPQSVATLCEVVDGLLRDDHFWAWYKEDSVRLYHAMTAERKRAVLVGDVIRETRKLHAGEDRKERGRCPVCRSVDALDAFDKGAENG